MNGLRAALEHCARTQPEPVARSRLVEVFGLEVELCATPGRAARGGTPESDRPAFSPNPGFAIRREETLWRTDTLVATPNRFPFARPQLLLWPATESGREPSTAFLAEAFALCESEGITVLGNAIGSSASIPLAHLHAVTERGRLAARLPSLPVAGAGACELACTDPEFGDALFAAIVEGGSAEDRARLVRALLDDRRTAAFNLVAFERRAYVFPRRAELGGPGFPYAVGAGELWGRFCFPDPGRFEAATAAGIAAALRATTFAPRAGERKALASWLQSRSAR